MRVLSSEWLKTKRTAVRWLTFFMPVITALCMLAYAVYRTDLTNAFIYEGFFTAWTAFIIPVCTGLLSGSLIHQEEVAGNFNALLNVCLTRTKLYMGKFFLLAFCITTCTLIAALLLGTGLYLFLPDSNMLLLFLSAALLSVIGSLPILAIHLWVSFLWGMGASIGIGMCGILMAALIGATSLGDQIFLFVPWAWPVKMSMFPMIYSFASDTIMEKAAAQLLLLFALTTFTILLFLLGGIIWFGKWESRTHSE